MLEGAARRLEAERNDEYATLVRGFLAPKTLNYLEAARYAREGLGEALWFEFLRGELDKPPERAHPESLELARAVWDLGSRLVITTNFDRVLHWVSPQQGGPVSWDIEAPAELAALLQDGVVQPTVWHLHGQINNKARLILTPDRYSLLYPNAGGAAGAYPAALQTLRSLLASHSFLFVGFSLDDVFFRRQLDEINQIYEGGAGRHYVLMREADVALGLRDEKAVKVIPFPDFGEPLLAVLRGLASVAAEASARPAHRPASGEAAACAPRVADYDPRRPVFYVPFRQKGAQVIGREESLQAVREQLTSGRCTAIGQTASFQGLGGLGKTQLAVEYAYRFRDSYPNGVIWLNADRDIDAQLTELGEKARWVSPQSEHKYKLEIARQRLKTYSECLIIFDNLEDLRVIQEYLPDPEADSHILVTSRTAQPGFTPVPLDPLDEPLSMKLLCQEAGRRPQGEAEMAAAREIAQSLGGLPLALELAGAYLQYRPISFLQYRDLLRQNLKAATTIKFSGVSFTRHETDLYSTLQINEEVFEEEPRLRDILDLLTWSGSAAMGLPLMCSLLGLDNPVQLTSALGLGVLLRLLQQSPEADSYSIHRLVGEVRREQIPLSGRRAWVDDTCRRIGDWFQERKEEFVNLPLLEAEIDHLKTWQEHAREYAPRHTSRLIWLESYPPAHRGRYQEADELVRAALKTLEASQEKDDDLKAHLLNDLGYCCRVLGDARTALDYHKQALSIQLNLFGEHHPAIAGTLSIIGDAHYDLGNFKQSLESAERAVALRRELFGDKHPEIAASLGDIGRAELRLNNKHRALEYSKQSLDMRQELLGDRHRDTGLSFTGVGNVYYAMGDYELSLKYAEKALQVSLECMGERHPDTATAVSNLGVTYEALRNYEESLKHAERSLRMRQELLGDKHPDTANSLNSTGRIYAKKNEYKCAMKLLERALEIRTEVLGRRHPDTLYSAIALANVFCKLSRPWQAYQLLDELLRDVPSDHPSYAWLKSQHVLVKNNCPGQRRATTRGQKHQKRKKKRR